MKILCITSSQPGHIDFGGSGFVVVAKTLQLHGHNVSWATFGAQVKRLRNAGFETESLSYLAGLSVMPFFLVKEIEANLNQHKTRVDSLRKFYSLLDDLKPDLLIIDRLLTYGALVADQLCIPYVAMGTPGGYWNFSRSENSVNVFPVSESVQMIQEYSESLLDSLKWRKSGAKSFWLSSPFLNACFMPRGFYPVHKEKEYLCANIFHHEVKNLEPGIQRMGISFGNQGDITILLDFLELAAKMDSIPKPFNVFVGNNEITFKKLKALYTSTQVNLHRWVDFDLFFRHLSCLVFLGGVGTIWRCVDNRLPMLIIPGKIGDQVFNARRVEKTGIGVYLKKSQLIEKVLAVSADPINALYRTRIDAFSSVENYTDTIESFYKRVLSL